MGEGGGEAELDEEQGQEHRAWVTRQGLSRLGVETGAQTMRPQNNVQMQRSQPEAEELLRQKSTSTCVL